MSKNKSDEKFLERLRQEAPEILEAEVDFDEKIICALPSQRARDKPVVTMRKPSRVKSKKKIKAKIP